MKPLITSSVDFNKLPNKPRGRRRWHLCPELPNWDNIIFSTGGLRVDSPNHNVKDGDEATAVFAVVRFQATIGEQGAPSDDEDIENSIWGSRPFMAEIKLMSRQYQDSDTLCENSVEGSKDEEGLVLCLYWGKDVSFTAWKCQAESSRELRVAVKKALSRIEANFEFIMDAVDPTTGKTGWQLLGGA
jgi:hypothetical protein